MKIDSIKYQIQRHFRMVYKVKLTLAQLDDIHDFYHIVRKEALKDLILYRFINMMLGVTFLILFFIFKEKPFQSVLMLIVWTSFVFYNLTHGIIGWIQYKRIKEPTRPSDEDPME